MNRRIGEWVNYLTRRLLRGRGRDAPPTGRGRDATPTGRGRDATPTGRGRDAPPTGRGRDATPTGLGQGCLFHCLLIWLIVAHVPYALSDPIEELGDGTQFWTSEMPLSLARTLVREPTICARGEEIFVAWSDNRLGQWEIFFRYSADGGITWQPEERVTVTNTDSVEPAIACDRQRVHILWLERQRFGQSVGGVRVESVTHPQIRYTAWDGIGWRLPQTLSLQKSVVRRPRIAAPPPDGSVYAVWERQGEGQGVLTTATITRSDDGGRTWARPRPITRGDWETAEPDVVAGIRSAFVTWRDGREATSKIYVKRWSETTVTGEFLLAADGNCRRPSIAVQESRVFVAWECLLGDISPADIFVATSADRGETWMPAQAISTNTTESIAPQLVVRQNDAWIFWQNGTAAGNWEIHTARHQSHDTWTQATQFTESNSNNSISPAVVGQVVTLKGVEEQLHLVWVEQSNANRSTILYSRRDTLPPIAPNQPFHIDSDAPAGFDNDLELTFAWRSPSPKRGQGSGGSQVQHRYHVFLSIDGGAYTELGSTAEDIFTVSSENSKQYRVKLKASDLVGNLSPFSEPSAPVFVDSNAPTVEIHLPLPDTVVTQPVPIIATCQDTNLVECRLQFGATIAPGEWRSLGAPIRIPFERERLTVWDTSKLNGVYTLALIAIDAVGNRSVTEIPVFIDGTPPLYLEGGKGVGLIDENLAVSFRTPAWGPDGQNIAFSSNAGGAVDIWMLDIGAHRRVRLTRDIAIDLHPTWHPNADLLAFQSQRYSTTDGLLTGWELWTVRADGSPPQPLISVANSLAFGGAEGLFASANFETPAWSPTGRQLAFAADLDGDLELWVMRNANDVLSGAAPDLFQLTRNSAQDGYPTWSPDETHLAFQSDRTGDWDIWQIRIDASDEKQVYRSLANETRPNWSPDGKRILFLSDQGRNVWTAFALSLQDGDLTEIYRPGVPIEHVDWSPDGSALVYQQGERLYTMALNFPAPEIEAKITHPFQGAHVQGKVNLLGLARGVRFREYRLEYAPTATPRFLGRGKETVGATQWQRIGGNSTAQVSREGFLGQWDTRRLHGVFVLRLIVVSANGEEISDSITVSVHNERPRLEIFEPPDGLLTTEGLLTVRGQTEPQVDISVNETPIAVDDEGNFRTQLFLKEGQNEIAIEAISPIGRQEDGLRTSVRRTVLRDTRAPEIVIDSPKDFTISAAPYITVSGKVDDVTAKFSINDISIPLRPNGDFKRTLRLKTDLPDATEASTNLIRVKAVDGLGRTTEAQRRVIYAPGKQVDSPFVQKDINSPAITEVMPPDGATQIYSELAHSNGKITAILVDDVAIDPLTIRFSFDGVDFVFDGTEEASTFDGQTFDFQPDTGQFTYTPSTIGAGRPLIDGRHTFKLEVKDTAGNAAEPIAFSFFVDTQPFDTAISAERVGNVLKVILGTNKPLDSIPLVEVLPSGASLGYPLNLIPSSENGVAQGTSKTGDTTRNTTGERSQLPVFRYVGEFPFSPSQSGFTLSATVRGLGGMEVPVVGYFTDEDRFPDAPLVPFPQIVRGQTSLLTLTHLFIEGGPAIMFLQQSTATGLRVTLRSQGGLERNLILAQRQNATDRGLTILQPVYVVEANAVEQEIAFRIGVPPPARLRDSGGSQQSKGKFDQTALFQWDERLQQWLPLDAHVNESKLMEAVADRLGHYALLVDDTPPTIQSLFEDGSEVPLERFLIEVEILDHGSGIDAVALKIDGQRAEFVWENAPTLDSGEQTATARLIYLPSNLEAGKHTFEVAATDRAGNVAQHHQTFSTRDIFAFADAVVAYPNPASSEVNINFKLTMSADVTLGIYNVVGELLYTDELQNVVGQQSVTRNERFTWKCKNQVGERVASGVYIYILEAEREGEVVRQTGKVAVVR